MYVLTEIANIVPHNEAELPDEMIVARVCAGEDTLFALLYQRYRAKTFALAYGMTGQREQADDLTQDIFLRVYQRLSTFQGHAKFSTWFYRISLNCCLNYCRRERSSSTRLTSATEVAAPMLVEVRRTEEAHEALLRQEIQQQIKLALLSLKPQLRMLLILKEIEGLSYDEIAERLECSTGTVASRLNRARQLLARKLESLKGKI
jgi:RNA polymerase sigma-70 factor (ECF subfamily)